MKPRIPRGYARLPGSERDRRTGARRVGPADPAEIISVTIRLRQRPGTPRLPDQKTWAATPLAQRKFLSPAELGVRYGADQKDIDKVVAFATSHGLRIVQASISRRIVVVSGTVNQISKAFAVDLGRYRSKDETYRGREGHIHVPKALVKIVIGVFGLDTRGMAQHATARSPARAMALLTPAQVAKLYNFPQSGAAGQTVGILEFWCKGRCGYKTDDIQQYFGSHAPLPRLLSVGVNGATNAPGYPDNSDAEVTTDIDIAGTVARGATLAVYFSTWDEQGWIQALTTALFPAQGQPQPSVLSISWGHAEFDKSDTLNWTQAAMDSVGDLFRQAAALGVTVFAATGDHGSWCSVPGGKPHVMYPAADPWVTACGGTVISRVHGKDFKESTWNNSSAQRTGVTGGGVSDNPKNPLPAWQGNAGVPPSKNSGRKGRGIPDVAGHVGSYSIVINGTARAFPGTSTVAPLYAGLIAVINSALGRSVGYLNPTLYKLGGAPVFRDIDDGIDNRDRSAPNAPSYMSGTGWDACTGWGSIDGSKLLDALRQSLNAARPKAAARRRRTRTRQTRRRRESSKK